MLNITATVTYSDGREATVTVGPATQVAFEREHNLGIPAIGEETKLSHIYWLAWHASKSSLDFDPWLEAVDEVAIEVATADPTKRAAPAV